MIVQTFLLVQRYTDSNIDKYGNYKTSFEMASLHKSEPVEYLNGKGNGKSTSRAPPPPTMEDNRQHTHG